MLAKQLSFCTPPKGIRLHNNSKLQLLQIYETFVRPVTSHIHKSFPCVRTSTYG